MKDSRIMMFPKGLDKLECNKVFLYCPVSLLECWNNMGEMLNKSPKQYLKIEIGFYQVYVVFPLMRVKDHVVLLKELSQNKGASRCMIIKLVNVHERAWYLYAGNWKGMNGNDPLN